MKYIVLTGTLGKGRQAQRMRHPIIFPDAFVHDSVAKVFIMLCGIVWFKFTWKVTSAGFVNSMELGSLPHGRSDSLGIESHPAQDARLIRMNDYGAGVS